VAAEPEQQTEKIGLKVQDLTAELAERLGYSVGEGVVISEVARGSPAANAGLQPGALIASVNRVPVKSVADFNKAFAKASGKKSVLLLVKQQNRSLFVVLKWE
jgi:serine protease Do